MRALAPLVQTHGVACLVADDPQWTVRANADGVHIEGAGERLQSALRDTARLMAPTLGAAR